MASDISTDIPIGALRKDALGVPHIVFFVVAAAAPLTAVVGVTPAAFMLGNGPGVPLTFLMVGLLYLLFSAGFTAMSGFVGNPHAAPFLKICAQHTHIFPAERRRPSTHF